MENIKFYELTSPQNSIWLTEQYYKGTPINNICISAVINQEVNFDLLSLAINEFIKNNDSFKLRFKTVDGKLLQYLAEDKTYKFEIVNLKNQEEVDALSKKMLNTVFTIEDSRTI